MLKNQESITAKMCAYVRAQHSNFSRQKIYDDYLAFDLLGRDEYEEMELLLAGAEDEVKHRPKAAERLIAPIILPRIRYAEELLLSMAKENETIQYVICGAGIDSFAFRNANPNIRIFELDHPNTQAYKLKRIKELGWIVPQNMAFVPIDFEKQQISDRLQESGFDGHMKTVFAILGVAYYLDFATLENTVENIGKVAAEGSVLVMDYPAWEGFQERDTPDKIRELKQVTSDMGEQMTEGLKNTELIQMLKRHAFTVTEELSPSQIQKEYFRKRTDNLEAFEHIHFLTAKKQGN